MKQNKLISVIVKEELPQVIRDNYPHFVEFIVKYYEWLEEIGHSYHFIAHENLFNDVDETTLSYLENFSKCFLANIPKVVNNQNNIRTLIKWIKQHYEAKGSEKSFEFLFRLLNPNSNKIDIYYPSQYLLRVSDGKWVFNKSIKIIDPPSDILQYENCEINFQTSGVRCIIDEITTRSYGSVNVAEIFILPTEVTNPITNILVGEIGVVNTWDNSDTLNFTVANICYGINMINNEPYYYTGQRIDITSVNGDGARIVVDDVSKGSVEEIDIVNGGNNYNVGDKIKMISSDFGNGAYGVVTNVDGSGAITEVNLICGGIQYKIPPKIEIISDNGTGAILMANGSNIGKISTYNIIDFGINYDNGTIIFNTVLRLYNVSDVFSIGEQLTDTTSGATGIIEYFDVNSSTASVKIINGTWSSNDDIVGTTSGTTAKIYKSYETTGTFIPGALCEYKGYYINQDGHISSLRYIQDSYFWQMFSYLFKTSVEKKFWINEIKEAHPAGTIVFGFQDIENKYITESLGGFIFPNIDNTEWYKFLWQPNQYDNGAFSSRSNTQIKQYANIVIDTVCNMNENKLNKTGFCYGSEVIIT